jgi:alpha-amylase
MVVQFVFEGIPVVYYGQEQDQSFGNSDPYNRNALWPSNYTNTTTSQRIATLNQVRSSLIANGTEFNGETFMQARSQVIAHSDTDVAIRKGPLLAVLTNRGSPVMNATFGIKNTGWSSSSVVVDILSCRQMPVGADDAITISYATPGYGGMPYVFLSMSDAQSIGICGLSKTAKTDGEPSTNTRTAATDKKNSATSLITSSSILTAGASILALTIGLSMLT